MKAVVGIFAAVCVIAASTKPATAQPPPGAQPTVTIAPEPSRDSLAKARELVKLMYRDQEAGDMEDWLFEVLMDRYRAAFTLADGAQDPAIRAAIQDELTTVQARLHPIVARHLDEIREGAAAGLAFRFGDQLTDIVAFAHTPGGQNYLKTYPVPVTAGISSRGLVADNRRLAIQINTELRQRAPDYLRAHLELEAAVDAAGGESQ
ncbi:MAG TPA: hypothetical protein VGM25_07675 [Caulobacteraceae bacterium]